MPSLAVGSFDAATFVTTYLPIPVFFILLVVYKLVKKSRVVNYEDMDFVTGCSADIPLNVRNLKYSCGVVFQIYNTLLTI